MIPVNEPLLDGREKELLAQCIDSGWISSEGPFVAEFEDALDRGDASGAVALYGGPFLDGWFVGDAPE